MQKCKKKRPAMLPQGAFVLQKEQKQKNQNRDQSGKKAGNPRESIPKPRLGNAVPRREMKQLLCGVKIARR